VGKGGKRGVESRMISYEGEYEGGRAPAPVCAGPESWTPVLPMLDSRPDKYSRSSLTTHTPPSWLGAMGLERVWAFRMLLKKKFDGKKKSIISDMGLELVSFQVRLSASAASQARQALEQLERWSASSLVLTKTHTHSDGTTPFPSLLP
jgi:hypothetical protein